MNSMTLKEKVSKLHRLSKDYEKLAAIVRSMEINEDAPVWSSEWNRELMVKYNQVNEHMLSLKGDLKL